MQGRVNLLRPIAPSTPSFSPKPDGRLYEDGRLMASFEAKYSPFSGGSLDGIRDHIYQAVGTAAACGAPLSILVYPGAFAPQVWDVPGLHGTPRRLIAVGLGLFRWLQPAAASARALELLELIDHWRTSSPHCTTLERTV
jgi:hypothetical protein